MNEIPESFQLLAHTVIVKVVPHEIWSHGEDCVGVWDPMKQVIELDAGYDGTKIGHTLWHEKIHAVLDLMGHRLARSESFVDQLAGMLHQAEATSKFPPKRRKTVKP